YGAAQRMGRVSFATVVLKRGMTSTRDLWKWFELVAGGAYAYRLKVEIEMRSSAGEPVLTWGLARALPVKFKAADLNARAADVGLRGPPRAHRGHPLTPPA